MTANKLFSRLTILIRVVCVLLLSLLHLWAPACAFAAKAKPRTAPKEVSPSMTVEELVHHSSQALNSGAWQAALEDCDALLRDYGDRPEVMRLKERVHLTLLHCHLQLGQWNEAAPLFDVVLQNISANKPTARGELLYQKAACELRLEQPAAACKTISASLLLLPPAVPLRAEAVLLQAACLLAHKAPLQAGELLENSLSVLEQPVAERALPLGMSAFLEAGHPGRACALLAEASRKFPGIEESTGPQTLLLRAGAALLEEGNATHALACLSRIAPPQRLIRSQQRQLASLEKTIASAQAQAVTGTCFISVLHSKARQLRMELDAFGNGDAFAAATRIQVATAYQALGRAREAALVLDDAIRQLPAAELLEHASLELAKIWLQQERWQKVVTTSEHFASVYPASKHLPLMLYLRGCALQKAGLFASALDTFSRVAADFKSHELCASARFMEAFTLLLDSRPMEAARGFASFLRSDKKHDLCEAAAYWLCIAEAQGGSPSAVRAAAGAYLAEFPNGENKPAVYLRRAQAACALREKAAAVPDLEEVLATAPEHACSGEAALLLGDCRLAAEDLEGALSAWGQVPTGQREAREEGLFKCAKLLHRLGRTPELRELLRAFDSEHAESTRLAEAAHWLWKACAQGGDSDETTRWILEHVATHGNNPDAPGIEALLSATSLREGTDSEKEAWRKALQELAAAAEDAEQKTLLCRLKWSTAKTVAKHDATASLFLLREAAGLGPAALTGPAVLADAAEALEKAGSPTEARRLWRELLKWHPRAPQRDRALVTMARFEVTEHRPERAWEWVMRFEQGTPTSPLLPRLLLVKAALQRGEGRTLEALRTLERVLRERGAGAALKCEALFCMGELHHSIGEPNLALPYLQRVYVSYGGFQPWAAKAYLASAEAFTAIGKHQSARNTYNELLASGLAPDAPERAIASSKLKALGGTP
jgi:tetratricopeptide (TPR) repeat protein